MLNAAVARLRALFSPGAVQEEIDEELRSHFDHEVDRHIALGANPQDAAYAARRAFGNVTLHREEARDAYGWRWLDELRQDMRYALRQIGRAPVVTAVIVLLLAAGVGLNAALISYVDALTISWPGSQQPDALVQVEFQSARFDRLEKRYIPEGSVEVSPQELLLFRQRQRVFDDVALSWDSQVALDMGGAPSEVGARIVTGSYFSVLRLHMALGSGLPRQDALDPPPLVVVSYRFWQSRLGGATNAVGTVVGVNNIPMRIVGVMPRGFPGSDAIWLAYSGQSASSASNDAKDPWTGNNFGGLATSVLEADSRGEYGTTLGSPAIIGRLRPGVALEQAQVISTVTAAAIHTTSDPDDRIRSTRLSPSPASEGMGGSATGIGFLSLIASLVLLIACANASILLLGRAVTRRREIAVRLSLGADRWRVVRQLLTESVLLSLLAAGAGMILLLWASKLLWVRYPAIPVDLAPRWAAVIATMTFATLTGMLFGIVPALHATRARVSDALKDGTAGLDVRRARLQRALVVAEVALSMMLVCGTGLLVHAFNKTMDVQGFAASPRVLVADLDLPAAHYTAARAAELFGRVRERIGRLPGVTNVGFANELLLRYHWWDGWASAAYPAATDRAAAAGGPFTAFPEPKVGHAFRGSTTVNLVDPGYFAAMQHPLRSGRDVARSDVVGTPVVAVVSGDVADSLWPHTNPIGRGLTVYKDVGSIDCAILGSGLPLGRSFCSRLDTIYATVVGVTATAKREELVRIADDSTKFMPLDELTIYFARSQWPDSGRVTLIVQTSRVDRALPAKIERVLRALDTRLPFSAVVSAATYQRAPHAQAYEAMNGVALMGALVLLVACVGIYAVIAFGIAQHTREIGIRLALGARSDQVVALFFRDGLWLSLIGLAIGVPLALFLMKLTVATRFGTQILAPATVASIVVVLLAVAAVASWLPARRAAAVDPLTALRSD